MIHRIAAFNVELESTLEELAACAGREFQNRKSVYPNLLRHNRMTVQEARKECEMMRDLRRLVDAMIAAGDAQMSLFDGGDP